MTKIALCLGHTWRSQGAISGEGLSEWQFNSDVFNIFDAETFAKYGLNVTLMTRTQSVAYMLKAINVGRFDLALDLHFNGHVDPNIQRAELLVAPGAARAAAYAEKIRRAWLAPGHVGKCAVLHRDHNWAGKELIFLMRTNCPAIILEPFYGRGVGWERFTVEYVADMVLQALRACNEERE
jgi:hypothetical protein